MCFLDFRGNLTFWTGRLVFSSWNIKTVAKKSFPTSNWKSCVFSFYGSLQMTSFMGLLFCLFVMTSIRLGFPWCHSSLLQTHVPWFCFYFYVFASLHVALFSIANTKRRLRTLKKIWLCLYPCGFISSKRTLHKSLSFLRERSRSHNYWRPWSMARVFRHDHHDHPKSQDPPSTWKYTPTQTM